MAATCASQQASEIVPPAFVDATAQYGLTRFTQTFSAAFADLDNDGDDDLVVSNHGVDVAVYLNVGGRFEDHSTLLPRTNHDRHGLTIYDFDGDGDRDIALATGGGGLDFTISEGSESQLFANRLTESGALSFEDVSAAAGIAFREWRGRWFMPIPAGRVDLYFEAQLRDGRPNLYLANRGGLLFERVPRRHLSGQFRSEGLDTLWDYDRDGQLDIIGRSGSSIRVLRGTPAGFELVVFPELGGDGVNALVAGDLSGDGYPDLFIGGRHGRGDTIMFGVPGAQAWYRATGSPAPGGDHTFEPALHLAHDEWTRSVAMVDLDANGWLDVVVLRGNESGGQNGSRFVLMSDGTRFERHDLPPATVGNADDLIVGFVDDDDRPDLFVTNGWGLAPTNVGPYQLLLNRTPARNRAVTVELEGDPPNTDAIGAQIELVDGRGRLIGYRMLAPRGQAQDSRRLHFGVGTATGPLRLRIRWPSGAVEERRAQ